MQVFTTATRDLLRQLKGHEAPVHATIFAGDKLHVLSGSDDSTVFPALPMGHRDVVMWLLSGCSPVSLRQLACSSQTLQYSLPQVHVLVRLAAVSIHGRWTSLGSRRCFWGQLPTCSQKGLGDA